MDQIGIREAKINLSKLLKQIKQGREVIITERGTPVGKIVPMPRENLSLAERLRVAISGVGFEAEAQSFSITVSIGISECLGAEDSLRPSHMNPAELKFIVTS